MKNIITSTFLTFFVINLAFAQDYTTPDTGVIWTLDDIATASPTTITVTGTDYTLHGNLVVSENDALNIDSDLVLKIDSGKLITVFGAFSVDSNAVTISATDQTNPYEGFRFEEFSVIDIKNATIEYGGGLRVLTETFSIDNCTLTNNVGGATSSAVIQLSRGMPQITNNSITSNLYAAIGSAANSSVSAYIFNNHIEANNQENSNRPQINLGTTMASDPLQIIQNTIIGDPTLDQAGGIAISNFVGGSINAIIDDNIISDNRYGITILGPVDSAVISNNIIEDNNIQGNPILGGSGINLITTTIGAEVVVTTNEIRRNLWGITLQESAVINLGDDINNPGGNIFADNGNGGAVYALYNNTPNPVSAKHNCWVEGQESTASDVEDVIFHSVDDSTLGEVAFEPFLCGVTVGIDDLAIADFSFYPNPVKNELNFNNIHDFDTVRIYGVQGNLVISETVSQGFNLLPINLPSGMYFVDFSNQTHSVTKKLIVQ